MDFERDLDRFEYIDEIEPFVYIYTAIVNSPRMGMNIRLVMLVNCCPGHYSRVLLYSTDLNLCPLKVIQYYKARFQIEFIFRDAKQHTGLADCQSLLAERRYTHLNASLTALNLLKALRINWIRRLMLKLSYLSQAGNDVNSMKSY